MSLWSAVKRACKEVPEGHEVRTRRRLLGGAAVFALTVLAHDCTQEPEGIPVVGMWGGNPQRTRFYDGTLPVEGELIKISVGRDSRKKRSIISTPLPIGHRLCFGDGHDTGHNSKLEREPYFFHIIDMKTGKRYRFKARGQIRSSPAFYNDSIFFGSGGGYLYEIDLDARLKWKTEIGSRVTSSPLIYDGKLFFGDCGSFVHAFDIKTHKKLWEKDTPSQVFSSPSALDGYVYAATWTDLNTWSCHCYAFDANTGEEKWHRELDGAGISASPAIDRMVFFQTRLEGNKENCSIYALDPKTGNTEWKVPLSLGGTPSLAVGNGLVVSIGEMKRIVVADRSGTVLWRRKIDRMGSANYPSPLLTSSHIYIADDSGYLTVFDIGGNIAAEYNVGKGINSSPVPWNGTVVFGCDDGFLYQLKPK